MSILIKGMQMPKGDDIVISIRPNGDVYTLDTDKDIFFINEAEACKVSTPHGRLIDAEVVNSALKKRLLAVDTAPTVIEAEEEE